MIPVLYSQEIRELDRITIRAQGIASDELMMRAADNLCQAILSDHPKAEDYTLLCGPGNNGGDGLYLACLLKNRYKKVKVFLQGEHFSSDNLLMQQRCTVSGIRIQPLHQYIPENDTAGIIIDALFGSGLNKPLSAFLTDLAGSITATGKKVLAMDVPSGMPAEPLEQGVYPVLKAHTTYSIQYPKLSFFSPEYQPFTGNIRLVNIGLEKPTGLPVHAWLLEEADVVGIFRPRKKQSHKGVFGHGLLLAGSISMPGAMLLSAEAALRSGLGLLTVVSSSENRDLLVSSLPEAMFKDEIRAEELPDSGCKAMAIGPGLGKSDQLKQRLVGLINRGKDIPVVLDADALNSLSYSDLKSISSPIILTPHPLEFDRLFGKSHSWMERLQKALEFCRGENHLIVLKGAVTALVYNSVVYLCDFGNAGLAKGGSGDVLCGILLSQLAQGYSIFESAVMAVYLQGRSASLLIRENHSMESMLPGDLVKEFGNVYRHLNDEKSTT